MRDASPALIAGQCALSGDGKRFAILRNGAVEVYDLPPVSAPSPEGAGDGGEEAKGVSSRLRISANLSNT